MNQYNCKWGILFQLSSLIYRSITLAAINFHYVIVSNFSMLNIISVMKICPLTSILLNGDEGLKSEKHETHSIIASCFSLFNPSSPSSKMPLSSMTCLVDDSDPEHELSISSEPTILSFKTTDFTTSELECFYLATSDQEGEMACGWKQKRKQAWRGFDSGKSSGNRTSDQTGGEENHNASEHHNDIGTPDDEDGERVPKEKTGHGGQNRGQSGRQKYHVTNGFGHGTSSANHGIEPSKPSLGPRMPDGTGDSQWGVVGL